MSVRHIVAGGLLGLFLFPVGGVYGQNPDLLLRVQAPTVELTTDSEFTAAVLLDSAVDNIQGWSLGVAHDPAVLELLGAEAGATTSTIKNGGEPDFLVINTEPNVGSGVTMAVVIALTLPITLDAGQDYELLRMSYRVVADPAQEDPCVPVEGSLAFSSALGDPAVATVVTVAGSTETPTIQDATVTVRCPGTLEFTRCEGDTENVYLEWIFGGAPTWDFLFIYRDGELLDSLSPDATSYTDEGLAPGDYQYTLLTFIVDDPTNPALIFGFCTATVIPVTIESVEPQSGYLLGGTEITVTGTAFTTAETTTLTFFDGESELPVELLEIVSETELRAATPESPRLGFWSLRLENERGVAEFSDAFEYGFIRGEANLDGTMDLSDGLFILGFLFLGETPPPCRDAADTNDDGLVDISDGIRVLAFLFLGDAPPPPPYPEAGQDPTEDDLGCLDDAGV